MSSAEQKQRLKRMWKDLVSGHRVTIDALVTDVVGWQDPLLVGELLAVLTDGHDGVPFGLSRRCKRSNLGLAIGGIGAIVAGYWSDPVVDGVRDRAHLLIPPHVWDADLTAQLDGRVERLDLGDAQFVFQRVPAAAFQMGMAATVERWDKNDVREVVITRDMWVAATKTTLAQWYAVMGGLGSQDPQGCAFVSFVAALEYCNRLSAREGLEPAYDVSGDAPTFAGPACRGYRLLTEAEWELAARAGTSTPNYFGTPSKPGARWPGLETIAWYNGESDGPMPVALRMPNKYGLYDMIGNAQERCWNRYADLPTDPQKDPVGDVDPLPAGSVDHRALRGSSYRYPSSICYSHTRFSDRGDRAAFRVARTAGEQDPELAALVLTAAAAQVWDHEVADFEASRPRCIRHAHGRFYVGTAGGITVPALHELRVFNEDFKPMHAHRTPFLVSSVEVVGDNVWASLGPGHLLRFGERGAAAPCEEGRYTNSAVLTTDGRSLIFGTTWDGVFVDNVWQGGMRKYCRGVAVDDEHIYAAYDDDKVRVHRRTDFKRVAILKDSAKVALGAGALATLNKQRTEIVLWDPLWHRELSRVPHGLSGQYPGISAFGGRFVVHTTDAVMVCEADGTHARRWQRPESDTRINAALLVGEDLVVGIAEASRNGGRILRIPLAALT